MTVDSWCSLSFLPQSGVLVRAQIEDLLYACGCEGLWDQPVDECRAEAWSGENSSEITLDSGEALLTAYFPSAVQPQLAGLALKLKALDLSLTEPQIELVENEDWLENWRRNFTVTELTENTLVVDPLGVVDLSRSWFWYRYPRNDAAGRTISGEGSAEGGRVDKSS